MREYQCDVCGKPYESKSGLRDHRKSHRDAAVGPQSPMPIADTKAGTRGGPKVNNNQNPAALQQALAALMIDEPDVLAYKVYDDRVVIIQGPVGFKREWRREA